MVGYLQEGTIINCFSWQNIVQLIYKREIKQQLLDHVDDQFYRALLEDKDHQKYIVIGVYNDILNQPVIKIKKWIH